MGTFTGVPRTAERRAEARSAQRLPSPVVPRVAVAVVALAAAAAWMRWLAVYQVDDAYIVYRYAANLARGLGFVFNPGERVEGVTCFLWTLFLAPFAAAGVALPRVAPILSGLAGLAVVGLLPGLSARLRRAGNGAALEIRLSDWAPALLLAAHPAFAYWSVGGLETVPFTLLLALALRDTLDEQARGRGRRSAVWLALAALVRPETPLLAAALGVGRVLDGPGRDRRERVADALRWGAIVAVVVVGFMLFRRIYFGDWLPNTYYAKMGAGLAANLERGWLYTVSFLAALAPSFGWIVMPMAVPGLAILIVLLAWGLPRPGLRSAALLICGVGLAVLLDGGDWMFLHRFWVPALPAIVLLMTSAAGALAKEAADSSPTDPVASRAQAAAAAAGLVLAASFVTYGVRERDHPHGLAVNAAGYRFAHHQVAAFLEERARPGDTVALMDVGIIGFESGLRVIDITGLTDPRVAHAPGGFLDKRYPVSALLAEAPRFFVLVEGFRMDDAIRADAEFAHRYRQVLERNHRFNWGPSESYVLTVYERVET